jgi:hypothetical protein
MLRIGDIEEDSILTYDIETDGVFPQYCALKMIAFQLGMQSEPVLVDSKNAKLFRDLIGNPNIIKVSYNGINFDDIVLFRHGFYVEPKERYDMYLAMKTVYPAFPSYSLKFVNWAIINRECSLLDAWHEPQAKLMSWLKHNFLSIVGMWKAPKHLLEAYCKHDVKETVNVFRAIWEKVQEPEHWKPYCNLELAMGEPLHEMTLLGRDYVSIPDIEKRIREAEKEKDSWNYRANIWSGGRVKNAGSNKQMTTFLHEKYNEDFEISETGNFLWRKADKFQSIQKEEEEEYEKVKADIENRSPSTQLKVCSYEVHDIVKTIGYFKSYIRAALYEASRGMKQDFRSCFIEEEMEGVERIPKAYYLSSARTRRFRSSSKFGINFQNQNKRSKVVQLVPRGWLGIWLDSTQIENVAHIWASNDIERRKAYETDEYWNEYVWLCNRVLGTALNREELDKIASHENAAWSVYKQYKTIKLALNFGMGVAKFATTAGLPIKQANKLFEDVHEACKAIRQLQQKVRKQIEKNGYVEDPFGHRYTGELDQAYKIVAYLIQGTGTGSVPKAMTIANYKTIHELDEDYARYEPCIVHPYTGKYQFGVICGTTHDECACRLSLGLTDNKIVEKVRELLHNMEGKFSKCFDGIPLRAKLSVSVTNATEAIELDHKKPEEFITELTRIINKGRSRE